jgi:hypothetical protein
MDVLLRFVMESHDYIMSTQTKSLWPHERLWVLADYGGHEDGTMDFYFYGGHTGSIMNLDFAVFRGTSADRSLDRISVGTTRQIQLILRYSLLPLVLAEAKFYRYWLVGFGPCHALTKPTL